MLVILVALLMNHLQVITKETKIIWAEIKKKHFMTISFIQIIKLGCPFTFTVYVLRCCLALAHYFWYSYVLNVLKKGRKTFLCGLCNDSQMARCQFMVSGCLTWLILPIWKIFLIAAQERRQMKLTRQCRPAWQWIWSWLCWCHWWKQPQPNHNLSCWLSLSLRR